MLLHREEAARYLRDNWGFKTSGTTLASWASRGTGPRYSKAGHTTVYSIMNLDEFAIEHISHPIVSGRADDGEAAHGA
jgi:hypothetical protein